MDIIIATTNKGKLKEFSNRLSKFDINLISLDELNYDKEIVEDKETFCENALIKAKTIYDEYGIPTIADDSGLCIKYLDNKPGVYSARYAGIDKDFDANIDKVLDELANTEDRSAFFITSLVFYKDEDDIRYYEGKIHGEILKERVGAGGFGYDPIFYLKDFDKTMAQITIEEKNKISHRGIAMDKLVGDLDEIFSGI